MCRLASASVVRDPLSRPYVPDHVQIFYESETRQRHCDECPPELLRADIDDEGIRDLEFHPREKDVRFFWALRGLLQGIHGARGSYTFGPARQRNCPSSSPVFVFEKLVEEGYLPAFWYFATSLEFGYGVFENADRAEEVFRRGSALGCPRCTMELSMILNDQTLREKALGQGFESGVCNHWQPCHAIAPGPSSPAFSQVSLPNTYCEGCFALQRAESLMNRTSCRKLFKRAFQHGCVRAYASYGSYLEDEPMLRKGIKHGCSESKVRLGELLMKDQEKTHEALSLFQEAMEDGNCNAWFFTAQIMIRQRNFWQAEEMLSTALTKLCSEIKSGQRALLSHHDPNPALELSNILSEGITDFSEDSLSSKIIKENYKRLHMVSFDRHVFAFKVDKRAFGFLDAVAEADPQELIQRIQRGVDVGCRKMGTGQNVLHVLCAREDQHAIEGVLRVFFALPEFDRLVSQTCRYGKRPIDYLPRGSKHAKILAHTRKTKALCFLFCTKEIFPADIARAIAEHILCPLRRHTESILLLLPSDEELSCKRRKYI